jgi:hypothetical protein
VWHIKRNAIPNAVALLGDYSKFDAHIHTHVLREEHAVWRQISGMSMKLLNQQLVNSGRVNKCDIKYTAVGTRMSGDRNTGGGNSVINILIFRTLSALTGVTLEILCDGDDSIVWLDRDRLDYFVEAAKDVIERVFGMQWAYDVAGTLSKEEYCHRALSYHGSTPVLIADPMRTLQRATWVVNKQGHKQNARILVGNLVVIYLSYPNCPVLSPVSYGLLKRLGAVNKGLVTTRYTMGEDNQYLRELAEEVIKPHLITIGGLPALRMPEEYLVVPDEARYDMHASFNISPEEQESIERDYVVGEFNPSLKFQKMRQRTTKTAVQLYTTNDYTLPEYD